MADEVMVDLQGDEPNDLGKEGGQVGDVVGAEMRERSRYRVFVSLQAEVHVAITRAGGRSPQKEEGTTWHVSSCSWEGFVSTITSARTYKALETGRQCR